MFESPNPSSTATMMTSALTNPALSTTASMAPQDSHLFKRILSPPSPRATPSTASSSQKPLAHVNSQEAEYLLEIKKKVSGVCVCLCVCVRACVCVCVCVNEGRFHYYSMYVNSVFCLFL